MFDAMFEKRACARALEPCCPPADSLRGRSATPATARTRCSSPKPSTRPRRWSSTWAARRRGCRVRGPGPSFGAPRRSPSPCLRADSLRAAGVTLSRGLFENMLRDLLVERAEYTVQLFEGSGTQWRKARCEPPAPLARCAPGRPCCKRLPARSGQACALHVLIAAGTSAPRAMQVHLAAAAQTVCSTAACGPLCSGRHVVKCWPLFVHR